MTADGENHDFPGGREVARRRGSEAEQKRRDTVAHDGRSEAETDPSGNGAEEKRDVGDIDRCGDGALR